MKTIVTGGIVLGVLCCVWMFVMGFTGWYRDPAKLNLFFVVIPIEIAVLFWTLRGTAAGDPAAPWVGRTYVGQLLAGFLASAIGGLVIIGGSLLFTTVVFPNSFAELRTLQEQMLRETGMAEAEIRSALDAAASSNTPIANALTGFVGTLATGLVASALIAIFVRAKPPAGVAGAR